MKTIYLFQRVIIMLSGLIIFYLAFNAKSFALEKKENDSNEIHPKESCQIQTTSLNDSSIIVIGLGKASAIAHHPKCNIFAVGSEAGIVQLYAYEENGQVSHTHSFAKHSDKVNALAFSPDGQFLVSGGADKTIHVFTVHSTEPVYTYKHSSPVMSVGFVPDEKDTIISASTEGVYHWNTKTNSAKEIRPIIRILPKQKYRIISAAFSADTNFLITGSTSGRRSPSKRDSPLKLWDSETGTIIDGSKKSRGYWKTRATISPDGEKVVSVDTDYSVKILQVKDAFLVTLLKIYLKLNNIPTMSDHLVLAQMVK